MRFGSFSTICKTISLVLLLGFSLHADLVISSPQGGGSNIGYDNILYNGPDDILSGSLIRGHTATDAVLVDFLGLESLFVSGGGQAAIQADDGDFTNLRISLAAGGTFTQLKFLLESLGNGNVQLSVTEGDGTAASATFPMLQAGNNWYTVVAIDGQDIRTVDIDSSIPGGAPIYDIQQVRIGAISTGGEVSPVPEPASVGLLGTVVIALAARKKRFATRRA